MAVERVRHRLLRQARTELERKTRATEKVRAEIEESARAGEYRRLGQLLLSRKDAVRRGDAVARVLDYDNATTLDIPLNTALTVAQNAEALFRRAKRAERRAEKAPTRLAALGPETDRARALVEEIERADAAGLATIEARLTAPTREQAPRAADGDRARFRTYTVTGGWQVLVGKSNKDNDVLTHKVARPRDLWFHARQAAGSHVILRKAGTGREPDQAAILEAAAIAAYHSKAGTSKRAAVCYTEARYVRKPRGSAPGLAVVMREKVVMVAPKLPES
jgi:predicted ribosome quality control (RQC) complex YloA/Tae2 family protein